MYQFYYSFLQYNEKPIFLRNIEDHLRITSIKPTMWEEHCLECAAPSCFKTCPHYKSRSDGRCKRFEDGIHISVNEKGCCKQAVRIKFRKWSNMMTIVFPEMLENAVMKKMTDQNQKLGNHLALISKSKLPVIFKWEYIRTIEYLRRRTLRKGNRADNDPDFFVFHAYSYNKTPYKLIFEIFENNIPLNKKALEILPGENLYIIDQNQFSASFWKPDNLLKVYPENDVEADIEILWCNFVTGEYISQNKPADVVKCVVWDLDKTIWDGTLLETDDPDSLKVRPGVLETIKTLDQKGILQSIASKNDYAHTWPVLEKMNIADYFLYPQINWDPKSESIRKIAGNLNINPDSFVLIDDSAFEREQVHGELPQVRVFDETTIGDKLLNRPEFCFEITEESQNRRKMYQAEQKRNILLEKQKGDIVEFLKSCQMKVNIFVPKSKRETERCYELVVRTNQLNMTGKKYDKNDFYRLLNDPAISSFAFDCKDIYGEYGIVGFGQYTTAGGVLSFKEFTMSCRVSGKYIESGIFTELLKYEKCNEGIFPLTKTNRNYLLRNTLAEIGCTLREETADSQIYILHNNLKNSDITEVTINAKIWG